MNQVKKRINVTLDNFYKCIDEIKLESILACDTETTGLNSFKTDEIFSIIITTQKCSYYFNFNTLPAWQYVETIVGKKKVKTRIEIAIDPIYILPLIWINEFNKIFSNPELICFIHNAKFDMHMLFKAGVDLKCIVYCTQTLARIRRNDLLSYSLENLLPLIGLEKSDVVKDYMKKHDCYAGDKPLFYRVIWDLITLYGHMDGEGCLKLGLNSLQKIKELDNQATNPDRIMQNIVNLEAKLTPVLFKMEQKGVLLDADYCTHAYDHFVKEYQTAAGEFENLTGIEYLDSEKCFVPIFDQNNIPYKKTTKGTPSFDDKVLSSIDHPIAKSIQTYRTAYKKAHTYFGKYLEMKDKNNSIHCFFNQSGTVHGRMSCREPNLQNVSKEKIGDSPYLVRKCFVPRENKLFGMIDYDQMEYRLMFDYAGELDVIDAIKGGLDAHTATFETIGGDSRDDAKTLNFLLLYGGGVAKLAMALNKTWSIDEDLLKQIWEHTWKHKNSPETINELLRIDNAQFAVDKLNEANDKKKFYFSKLPKVKKFTQDVMETAKQRGYIHNFFGRRCYFKKGFEYAAPNHLIAGSCADVVKKAMINLDQMIIKDNLPIDILLQIHDEIIFEVKKGYDYLLKDCKKIMEDAYPYQHLPLTAGISISNISWANKEEYK